MTTKEDLLLFFDRPQEPCFMQKGDKNTVIQIPEHYYPDKYKTVSSTLENRFGESAGRTLQVSNIAIPDLSVPMQLPYNGQFSLFVNHHRTVAGHLIDIFLNMRNLEDLISLCSYCQLRINPYLFNYALSVAILHRPDTTGLNIPNFAEVFPDKFVDPKVINKAREVTNLEPMGDRMPIMVPANYTAADSDLEQRLAYFREDIGINLHHWHWHLVYPFESANESIVNKDRRGELFYYMHQQIIARYNTERMCNGVDRVKRLNNFREPIVEAYFPKMESQVASRTWPPRFAGSYLRDLNRPSDQVRAEIIDLENSRDRFLQAIEKMAIQLPNGRDLPLDETTGIDILGNLMESSSLSRNRPFYGNMHNLGHIFIAYCHDPEHKYLEQFGVMGDSGTAMRDPIFYRWHSFIDDIFQLFKAKLTPYNNTQLDFNGIRVSSVGIEGSAGPNTISTFWEQSTVNLGRGLDFMPRGSVLATFTHLQHTDFTYVIDANNTTGQNVMGTVRIFIAPTRDDAGQPLSFEEQRKLMIELDKFTQALRPGNNKIRQSSTNSSVTIPYERTFRDQGARVGTPGTEEAAQFDFCGCGWPHHMLTPKGTTSGFPMVLFAMVSNWNDDRIDQDLVGACNDASSYCGIRDRKYPDKRAMGFPFDRRSEAAVLSDFLKPNMATRDCTIRFTDTTRQRGQQA